MGILARIKTFVMDPPPELVFEISAGGIAWAQTGQARLDWTPLDPGVIDVNPLENNIRQADAYASAVRSAAANGDPRVRRRAALILPDYCGRVAVLDFDTFPADAEEQVQLARFRVKRVVPFDIDNAVVACYAQPRPGPTKKVDVVTAMVSMEVAAHYEAPFRAAGLHCGFVTLSALAALSLGPGGEPAAASPWVMAKMSGDVVAVTLLEENRLRMFRCVRVDQNAGEATSVLATTIAYAEDELGARPSLLRVCGLGPGQESLMHAWAQEFAMPVTGVRGRFGQPGPYNAGLAGYLESTGAP